MHVDTHITHWGSIKFCFEDVAKIFISYFFSRQGTTARPTWNKVILHTHTRAHWHIPHLHS